MIFKVILSLIHMFIYESSVPRSPQSESSAQTKIQRKCKQKMRDVTKNCIPKLTLKTDPKSSENGPGEVPWGVLEAPWGLPGSSRDVSRPFRGRSGKSMKKWKRQGRAPRSLLGPGQGPKIDPKSISCEKSGHQDQFFNVF